VYNGDAFDWIRKSNLDNANQLDSMKGMGMKSIAPFPARSIVLKHMYWPVRGDGFTALPLWDSRSYPPNYAKYAGYEYWKRIVVIDPRNKNPKPGMKGVVNYLFNVLDGDPKNPNKPLGPFVKTGQIVPVEAFYHQQVDTALLASFSPGDRAILNASACWLYNRPFQAGDYLVAVASHIITKEVPSWTLQSVWWHDKPNAGPFAQNRPNIPATQAPGPWRHYLMTVEYGVPASPGKLPMAFNPYIELAAGHPIQTNCRNCHLRAAWPHASSSYEAKGGPGALADISANNPIFNNLLLLDFQWAVSDRAGVPPMGSSVQK
jgi:hypothetical protein